MTTIAWVQSLTDFAVSQRTDRVYDALTARGASEEQIQLFQIGYLNKGLPSGMPEHFLEWSKWGQKLEDVYVFPLTTTLGEIRGLQFRHVDRERSGYIDFLLDRREPCLFGLAQAIKSIWESQSVYLVEGVFDLLPIQRATPFVVATMTAHANYATVRLFRRFVKRVWLGYDMDDTGRKGCREFLAKYGHEFEVFEVRYPEVHGKRIKDPGDLWEAWGDSQIIPYIHTIITRETFF